MAYPTKYLQHLLPFLIFTLLTLYDEEWDVLVFQEYRGSRVSIIIWQSMSMVFGYIIFLGFWLALSVGSWS